MTACLGGPWVSEIGPRKRICQMKWVYEIRYYRREFYTSCIIVAIHGRYVTLNSFRKKLDPFKHRTY